MKSIIMKELRHHGPFTLLGAAFSPEEAWRGKCRAKAEEMAALMGVTLDRESLRMG